MAYLCREARREQIMTVVMALVTNEGLAAATVRRIAQELGCSPGQIHHHFASAEALRAEAVREVWRRIEPELHDTLLTIAPRARLMIMLGNCVELLPESVRPAMVAAKRMWREARDSRPGPEVREAIAEGFERLRVEVSTTLQRGIDEGVFPAETDLPRVVRALIAASIGFDLLAESGAIELTGDKAAFVEQLLLQEGL